MSCRNVLAEKKRAFNIMFVEDTYSSEEMVDQQPVLVKIMDTADQVMIYSNCCLRIHISS